MPELEIVIGTKAVSSWSLRPWLALKATGQTFKETLIELHQPDSKEKILKHSPAGQVPVLKHGSTTLWESLSICEYIAETFPAAKLWPGDPGARAVARCVATEMHGGFGAVRAAMSMDVKKRLPTPAMTDELKAQIARITQLWNDSRRNFGVKLGGPFLFGRFSIADCMWAPVTTRFTTYGVTVDPVSTAYIEAMADLPDMKEWVAAA